jgi:hypothetical protein
MNPIEKSIADVLAAVVLREVRPNLIDVEGTSPNATQHEMVTRFYDVNVPHVSDDLRCRTKDPAVDDPD